jgi:hypothetical protein
MSNDTDRAIGLRWTLAALLAGAVVLGGVTEGPGAAEPGAGGGVLVLRWTE